MKGLVSWFASNGVVANLLMVVILVGGALSVPEIRKEVFPEFSIDRISVSVIYPGAAPEEVEEGICIRIEEAVQSLTGVKRITSTASEGMGIVNVEVLEGTDIREFLDEVKGRVDAISTFPEEAEQPVIQEVIVRNQVINVAVSGQADERTLKRVAEQVRDEVVSLPGITQAELSSARPYEVSIEISEEALLRHGLSFDQVAQAVRRSSLDLPGGSVRTEAGEILLRTKSQAYVGEEFRQLTLLSRPDGTRILLGDVARVVDGFAETDQAARFDGQPAILVQVFRVGRQSALEIAAAVREYVKQKQLQLPAGLMLTTWKDDSRILRSRLDLLIKNGLAGLALVVLSLTLFLRVGLAFWVSLGIPISFLGCLMALPHLDVSINLISLFAFIVVLGIVVDDAIVVGENIFTQYEQGKPKLRAVIDGTQEMMIPVFFAVATTVAAFSPLLMIEGSTGKIMRVIPLVVLPTLVFSLIESLLILPHHLSHLRRSEKLRKRGLSGLWNRLQELISGLLKRFVKRVYEPLLGVAVEWRYLTAALGVSILVLVVGMILGGRIKFNFFPPVEADNVMAFLTMPQGTPAETTARAMERLEQAAAVLQEEIDSSSQGDGTASVFRHVLTSVGEQPSRVIQNRHNGGAFRFSGAHLGEVNIELAPSEERPRAKDGRLFGSTEIANRWRELTGIIPDAVELSFSASIFAAGAPINVQFSGPDLGHLQQAADKLKMHLSQFSGVYDIADSFRAGKQEIQLKIHPAAESLGLAQSDLARQVRQAFYGEEVQRIQRGRDEVKIMVRYPSDRRRSLGQMEGMRIRTPDGGEVPFSVVADSELSRGFASIRRVDRNRSVSVTAEVDTQRANSNEILAELERGYIPSLLREYPGLTYSLEGEQEQQKETVGGLMQGFGMALAAIFVLLAIPLRSYFQPLLIMSAIPFGLVGAFLGHKILGMDLSILSVFGIVALAGVVVNDSLILVDYVNRQRRAGVPLRESILTAGSARFRPIFLTSLTTFAGLTPLLMETSLQAQFLIPMAISLAFGVVFSSPVILVLVPCTYMILEDMGRAVRWLLGRPPVQEPKRPNLIPAPVKGGSPRN